MHSTGTILNEEISYLSPFSLQLADIYFCDEHVIFFEHLALIHIYHTVWKNTCYLQFGFFQNSYSWRVW